MFGENEISIIKSFYTTCTMLSFIGAVFLFLRSHGKRSRRFHACAMMFCCTWYLLRMIGFYPNDLTQGLDIMNVWAIIIGTFCLLVLSLYPLEILRPGWLTVRRSLLLSIPIVGSMALFFVGTEIEGEGIAFLEDWSSLWHHLTMFNVWSRFLMLGAFLYYFISIVVLIFHEDFRYRRWRVNHLPPNEVGKNDLWLRNYAYWFILILIGYLYLVLWGYNPVVLLYHNTVLQLFLLYSFYKVLFYDNPYREVFYFVEESRKKKELAIAGLSSDSSERNFKAKLSCYKQEIECWFEQERPYLREDFRLKDVSDRLKLNRSYVSRIFNEGYGKSFSLLVRDYRLHEAERLLLAERECSVAEVAERCGFSSSSSFIRTFTAEHDGVTPGQYREKAPEL